MPFNPVLGKTTYDLRRVLKCLKTLNTIGKIGKIFKDNGFTVGVSQHIMHKITNL